MTEDSLDTQTDQNTAAVLPDFRQQVVEFGRETVGNVHCENPFMIAKNVNVYYGDNHAIKDVTLEIGKKQVVALIGPSGCGKSTFLRCLNRMNFSKTQSIPQEHLRQRCVRPQNSWFGRRSRRVGQYCAFEPRASWIAE